jgi:peptidoglycan-associated lipoprotein
MDFSIKNMKLNNLILPVALALIAAFATTGCKHGPNGQLTTVPGQRLPAPSATPADFNTKPIVAENTPPIVANTNPPVVSQFNGNPIPTSAGWDPADMNQDREKLAAYTVHFKFDSAIVQDHEQANVANVGQALSANPAAKLLVEGHCDERGTEEYNRSLGERRALALREALAKIGIDPMRIRTISYGKDQPVDPGHDESAWAKNRRGQFVYCTPKAPVQ